MNRSKSGGFTLIESLVSLTLLTVGLIPAFLQASQAVSLSASIRNSLIASHLAQEGVEVVRAIRDENWFLGQPFDTGLACPANCRVTWNSTALIPALSGQLPIPLRLDPTSGLYQYTTGDETLFSRTIQVEGAGTTELTVIATVTWVERGGVDKTFSLEAHLFDWLQ